MECSALSDREPREYVSPVCTDERVWMGLTPEGFFCSRLLSYFRQEVLFEKLAKRP